MLIGKSTLGNEVNMTTKSNFSDEQLIRLAQKGNLEAYNQLLQRYSDKIKRIIYFYTNDWTYVNDLSQDVLFKIFKYLPSFNEQSKFSTWVYKIAQNTIKNHYRASLFRSESEQKFVNEQTSLYTASPESDLIGLEMNVLVEEAMANLPRDLRTCYGMHLIDGKTYEDIAKKMKCPIGTVRSRISRAKKQIKELVGNMSSLLN